MNIFAYMVTRNEAGRYLTQAISNVAHFAERIFVLDDDSTDTTRDVLLELGKTFPVDWTMRSWTWRKQSFLEHEGFFRQVAWDLMADLYRPSEEDWILTLDADEMLYPADVDLFRGLLQTNPTNALEFPVREVFEAIEGQNPLIRHDGFWGSIRQTRLVRYQSQGRIAQRAMGSGSVPEYAKPTRSDQFEILHYGYARHEDRLARYERYKNRVGHNPRHIESILRPGVLRPWVPSELQSSLQHMEVLTSGGR